MTTRRMDGPGQATTSTDRAGDDEEDGRAEAMMMRTVRAGNNNKEDVRAEATTMRMVRAVDDDEEDGQSEAANNEDVQGR